MPFEAYLLLASKYELAKSPRWKLARQALEKGTIYMSENLLNDLFGDCAQMAIEEGVKNLRRVPFPKQLLGARNSAMQYVQSRGRRWERGTDTPRTC